MKRNYKNIFTSIFIIFLFIEICFYFSEYDLTTYLAIPISIATSITSILLINKNFQNKKLKISLSIIAIFFTLLFFLWEIILASLTSANEISQTWHIDKYRIQSITRSFEGPKPSFYSLTEQYFFGIIHKDIDITFPENLTKVGNKCILKFDEVNLSFDLCNLKQETIPTR
ncbi:hypothetical protein [Flavobacterium davisii]|uniref:hypothetical protein n=1 Tax=Flavobacterium davisii TaxID=2906077 RepID=UPI000B4C25EC|nr:hypothetical protein [Flavobacterium davisii]